MRVIGKGRVFLSLNLQFISLTERYSRYEEKKVIPNEISFD